MTCAFFITATIRLASGRIISSLAHDGIIWPICGLKDEHASMIVMALKIHSLCLSNRKYWRYAISLRKAALREKSWLPNMELADPQSTGSLTAKTGGIFKERSVHNPMPSA